MKRRITPIEMGPEQSPIPKEVLDVLAQRFADQIDADIVKEMLDR
jgi:hypothetical protein